MPKRSVPTVNVGQNFGKWTVQDNNVKCVIKEYPTCKQRCIYYVNCQCECGTVQYVRFNSLKNGNSDKCMSCIKKCHGKSSTRIYNIWEGLKQRCLNINAPKHACYIDRGISIHEDWLRFEPFYEWAMDNGYQDGLEIDRINNDGNYEPDNCRFVTRQQNNMNRRGYTKKTSSKYKGVTIEKSSGRWLAQIGKDYKHYYLGTFDTQEDAALAYNRKAIELFGEHAHLNVIEESNG